MPTVRRHPAGTHADEPVSAVTLRPTRRTLDARTAAAELGLTPSEFAKRLAEAPTLVRTLGR